MDTNPPVTHRSTAKFLLEWHEVESWGDMARSLLGIKKGRPPKDKDEAREIRRVAALLSAQARGETRSDEVMRLLEQEPRVTPHYTLAFRFRSRADFEAARAAVDAHPGGRSQWLLEQVQGVSDGGQ